MERSTFHVTLTCILVCNAVVGAAFYFTDADGVVRPQDPFLFVGDPLELFCNITNPEFRADSSNLGFRHNADSGASYIVPDHYITILTTKSIRLFIPNMNVEKSGNYVCFETKYDNTTSSIALQHVMVENKPKRIESIDCLVYNWQTMTCSWDLGDLHHPELVKVDLRWATIGKQHTCPNLTRTSCEWPVAGSGHKGAYMHGRYYYIIKLLVKIVYSNRTVYESSSPQFKVDTNHYVKPAPIRFLKAEEASSTCINLEWQHPSEKSHHKTYEGTLEITGSRERKEMDMTDVQQKISLDAVHLYIMTLAVCHLRPYTDYTFNISVLPYPPDSDAMAAHGYRSDWVSIPARTRQAAPAISPPICSSCYHMHQCPHPRVNLRCAIIYWGDTPKSKRNGEFTKYWLDFKTSGSNNLQPMPVSVRADVTNFQFDISDDAWDVELKSETSAGQSPTPSIFFIPKKYKTNSNKPPMPTNFLVETYANNKSPPFTFHLSWEFLGRTPSPDSNITVAWCTQQPQQPFFYICKSHIHWIQLPINAKSYTLITTLNGSINVGIATEAVVEGRVVGSGIRWANCIYHRKQVPKRIEHVGFSENPPIGGLVVKWSKPGCLMDKAFIIAFMATICATRDNATCYGMKNNTGDIPPTMTDYAFTNLKSTENYLVTVSAKSSAGYGLPSDPVNARVLPFKKTSNSGSDSKALSTAWLWIIIALAIFVLLIVFIAFYRFVRFLQYKWRSAQEAFSQGPARLESKQPLNQPCRFQDRPLPDPPTAALQFYGLNACMMNLGSNSRRERNGYPDYEETPFIGGTNIPPEYEDVDLKYDGDSGTSSGIVMDPGVSSRSASSTESDSCNCNAGVADDGIGVVREGDGEGGVYSVEKNIDPSKNNSNIGLLSDVGDCGSGNRLVSDDRKCPKSHFVNSIKLPPVGFKPHNDKVAFNIPGDVEYELPVSPDSAVDISSPAPQFPNQDETLPRRPHKSGYAPSSIAQGNVTFNLGQIMDHPAPLEQTLQCPPPTSSPAKVPSSSPPVPPREPYEDKPPPNNAPLPPMPQLSTSSTTNPIIPIHIPNNKLEANTQSTCDQPSTKNTNPDLKRDPDSETFLSVHKPINQHDQNNPQFHAPPPPPYPPSPHTPSHLDEFQLQPNQLFPPDQPLSSSPESDFNKFLKSNTTMFPVFEINPSGSGINNGGSNSFDNDDNFVQNIPISTKPTSFTSSKENSPTEVAVLPHSSQYPESKADPSSYQPTAPDAGNNNSYNGTSVISTSASSDGDPPSYIMCTMAPSMMMINDQNPKHFRNDHKQFDPRPNMNSADTE